MRSLILKSLLMLPFLAAATYSGDCLSFQPGDSFVFSSEDSASGSYLGVDTRDITPDRLGPLQLKEEHGVEVTMVDQDAPAGKAGLKEHDVILTVNGQAVESVEQLRRVIREIPSGRVVNLGISRDGKPLTVQAQLASRKGFVPDGKSFHVVIPPIPPIPPMPEIDIPVSIVVVHSSAHSGLMVENLTSQLADYFGAREGRGVLVRSVEKGSRAEKAGFHAGDVIIKVNGETIHDAGDFSHALRSRKDNTASVSIIRDKKEQTITLALPERKESDLLEESLDVPEIDAETQVELSEANDEIARVRPEMELATTEIESMKPELEKQLQDLCRQQIDIKQQVKDQIQLMKRDLLRQKMDFVKPFRLFGGSQADI
jgi:serine protease Do